MDVRKTPCGERGRKWLGPEAGYFVRRPLRKKSKSQYKRGALNGYTKGVNPPPLQLSVNCLKPEILHERDLPNPAATLVRWPCRVSPERKGLNVSQEARRGTESQGSHPSMHNHYLFVAVL